jgi:thymidine kinase
VLRLDEQGEPMHDGAQVVIGGNESYVSVCRKHFKEAMATCAEKASKA